MICNSCNKWLSVCGTAEIIRCSNCHAEQYTTDRQRTTTFENAVAGDPVWSIEYGWGTVSHKIPEDKNTVLVDFNKGLRFTYKRDTGIMRAYERVAERTLFWKELIIPLAPMEPVRKLKRPILAKDTVIRTTDNVLLHVDGSDRDTVFVYPYGKSSKTTTCTATGMSWDDIQEIL